LLSTRQRDLHHHSRQGKQHSHSPIYGLWRHGIVCDIDAHRMRRGEGFLPGATHATPSPVSRALGSWGFPARSGASSTLWLQSRRPLTGLITMRDRGLCCSHASSCALKPLFVAVINVHVRIRRQTSYWILQHIVMRPSLCSLPQMRVHCSEHVEKRAPTVFTGHLHQPLARETCSAG
jgi:hypothetical protein